jgi:hypothetical protein
LWKDRERLHILIVRGEQDAGANPGSGITPMAGCKRIVSAARANRNTLLSEWWRAIGGNRGNVRG